MRKIKFRGFDDVMQTMVYESDDPWFTTANILKNYSVVMQYTGLEDINDKEIYENDVLKFDQYNPRIGVVKWIDDGWAIVYNEEYICGVWDCVYNCSGEIIGNTYKNDMIKMIDVPKELRNVDQDIYNICSDFYTKAKILVIERKMREIQDSIATAQSKFIGLWIEREKFEKK